ncbi:response regulator [Pseudobacteriovorax antillogorgiicola]|uniref:Two-component system, chemotaxis family, response regulator CheY n=1 Tax=Pseudobacteriovorax antillogorgiicola TaxID=1513793 RepID=A0A1Y6C8T1_9BACT|nr:response regulator [Pseudobacteriovorax antillogorgiicola]TCS49087.1 two-component system chemotaxis response regulator CheY [Pseudobacteriovorax antillogorgiicola]SMF51868.1 two-component system, chemotaxis family, response regulator CheY [Pseudobacteriovorax antillogorgiicola]
MDGPSVLIIDDDEDIRTIFTQILKSEGYDVYDAIDGLDTVQTLDVIKPDILLLDLKMPRMDGFEALTHIRSAGFQEPIIIITGLNGVDVEDKALELGANAFLRKPVRPDDLKMEVKACLSPSKTISIA